MLTFPGSLGTPLRNIDFECQDARNRKSQKCKCVRLPKLNLVWENNNFEGEIGDSRTGCALRLAVNAMLQCSATVIHP